MLARKVTNQIDSIRVANPSKRHGRAGLNCQGCQDFFCAAFLAAGVNSATRLLGQSPNLGSTAHLRRQEDRAVEVRSCAVKNRAVSNRNCVAAIRGGEQRNENDQSVTKVVPEELPP